MADRLLKNRIVVGHSVKNDFDAKILINGVPDHRLIIANKESGFLEALELEISEYYKENTQS